MKRFILLSVCTLLAFVVQAQQNQKLQRVQSALLFEGWPDATVVQSFNRKLKTKANIFLKDASLVYRNNDGKVMKAHLTKNILGVNFGDSLRYLKIDETSLGKVIAQKGYNYLLCKTSVNMPLYREETDGGKGMDYFDMPDNNVFLNLDSEKRDDEQGIPLMNTYYFSIMGTVIPATESEFKNFVSKDQMQAFKVLKENRFWSWKDEESLKMLFDFLPE